MTAKQKAARLRFKKVVAEATKLRKKNPKLTQAQAVKQAWAIQYSKEGKSKKVAAIKIIEKGESKSAKPKATYQQVRSKKGTFKGLRKVGYDQEITASNFTRISNDTYGNPRYVIHYLNIDKNYDKAVKIANKLGGKKFNNKQFGGGIVFQSYSVDRTAQRLNEEINKSKKIGAASSKVNARKGKSTEMHTDTKSHNVNIRVVSGMPISQGDYLVSTWGYDQTNVDFYYVTKISKGSAYIIPASQKIVEYGDTQGRVIPKEPNFNATPVRRKIKKYSGGEYIKLNTFSIARKWEGNPVWYSSYA